jgi:hypothetical protein
VAVVSGIPIEDGAGVMAGTVAPAKVPAGELTVGGIRVVAFCGGTVDSGRAMQEAVNRMPEKRKISS